METPINSATVIPAPLPRAARALVYGGIERQRRSDVSVWRAMDTAAMIAGFEQDDS